MKNDNTIPIQLDTDRISRNVMLFCIAVEIILVVLDVFINYFELSSFKEIQRLFNIAREDSLASLLGTIQTFMAGMTLCIITFLTHHSSATRRITVGWFLLSFFFIYMAIDDGAEIHERLGSAFDMIAEPDEKSVTVPRISEWLVLFPSYTWQFLFLPFFGCAGVFTLGFLMKMLRRKKAKLFVIAALSCFVFAVGLDFFEGLEENHKWNFHTYLRKEYSLEKYTVRHFSKSLEEFIEMLGITFFWASFVLHFESFSNCMIRFKGVDSK